MNLDFSALSKSLPKIKNLTPLDELAQEAGAESQQMRRLQHKVDEQRHQLEQLMKVLSDSKQEVRTSENRYRKPAQDDMITFQLLEEIKNLKRQIQKLEDGPRASQPPFIAPFIPQQQYQVPPYYMNYPIYAPPPAFQQYPPYYGNPYEIANNQPIEYLHQLKKKQEKQEIKQAILELLQNGEIQGSKQQKHRQILKKKTKTKQQNSNFKNDDSYDEDDFPNESVSDNRYSNRTRQESQSQNIPKKKTKRQIKPLQTLPQSQNKTIQPPPPKVKITPEKLKMLKSKFRAITKWVIFCFRKHWDKLEQEQMNIYDEKIGTFDSEFLYEVAIKTFFGEGDKKKLFKQSWVITENKDIPNRANHLIMVCQTLLTTVITTLKTAKFSDAHQQYMSSFTKNGGYLFTGHSAFVAQRLEIKYNKTLIFASDDQRKMALLEYAYISTFLMEFMMSTSHWTRLITNYKEPLKLLISYLQNLYVDRFKTLHVISPNIRLNKSSYFLKFDAQNFNDIKQIINAESPNYQITTKFPILGLYDETVLQPVLQQNTHQGCKNVFNDLCELMFSKIQV